MKGRSKTGKIKLSILKRIALLFLAALLFSGLIVMMAGHSYLMDNAAGQGAEIARVVATSAMTVIGSDDDFYRLMTDEDFRTRTHTSFRYICKKTDVRYLYLYTIDENGLRTHIVTAAQSDEDDENINKDHAFGMTNSSPLLDAERAVLNGDEDGEYEFVDNRYGNVCMYVYPVIIEGKLFAILGVDYSIEHITTMERAIIKRTMIIGLFVVGSAFIIALILVRQNVIGPILVLSDRMRSFVNDRDKKKKTDRRDSLFEDEITDIEDSFDKMADDIEQYLEEIGSLADERAQNHVQLDIARKIQAGFVPVECSGSGNGYEVYGCEYPAKDVGGDFYDIFSPDDENICVIVGDISGKGISAALFMTWVRTSIREKIKNGFALNDALETVNREICMSNPQNMFATVFAIMLNTGTGIADFANAGHEPPLILGKDTSYLKMDHGIALGLFIDAKIVSQEIVFNDGEGIFIYTDGITETVDKDMVHYGRDSLRNTVNDIYVSCGNIYSPDRLTKTMVSSVRDYSEGLRQFDDITCVTMVYNRGDKKNITPDLESFASVKRSIISAFGENSDSKRMILACEEIYANIVNYSKAESVNVLYERTDSLYTVTFTDNGIPFDPVNESVRDKGFEELDSGGMGIRIAKMSSKEMIYTRSGNRNILTLKFDIVSKV